MNGMSEPARPRALHSPDVLTAACPSRRALELIADKWAVLVMHALAHGPERFAGLQRRIQGVSQKMLTQTLRRMEQNGLVAREEFPTKPPAVEYRLTVAGERLLGPVEALCAWAERYGLGEGESGPPSG
jgi:DNA-binding HxlR family transcriptional regulator